MEPMSSNFEDGAHELGHRLARVDALLLWSVRRQRERPSMREKGQFWGTLITDDEVDTLLRDHGEVHWPVGDDGLAEVTASSVVWRDAPGGRFGRLRQAFSLEGDDIDLLLLALAVEVSSGYGRIFGYLNDNLNQGYLTVDLATRILSRHRSDRLRLQERLLPSGTLVSNRLLFPHITDQPEPQASRRLVVAPQLLPWILSSRGVDWGEGVTALSTDVAPFLPVSTRDRLQQLSGGLNRPVSVAVVGQTTGARESVASAVARAAGRPLVRIDLSRATGYLQNPRSLLRDLKLDGAVPYLVNAPNISDEPALRQQIAALGMSLSELPYVLCVGGHERRAIATLLGSDRPNVTLPVGRATSAEREQAWGAAWHNRGWTGSDGPRDLASRFYAIGGTTIERVLARAEAEAGGEQPDLPTLWAAAREAARPELKGLAQRIVPQHSWTDLILPDRVVMQLRHLEEFLAQQETVLDHWGGRKIRPRGYGLKALFSGSPGTGKTMCAEVIAGSLGLDLFKVDLSAVVSRWVGETEKNLREVFDSADAGNAVLLFDEADALFGSRGDVKQAQDRFANQEVSYLLQRLEVFEGCAILTTNLQENIDEAFLRRFGAVVEFPMPSVPERERLWERAIPPNAPMHSDVDLKVMSQQFILSGGSIVNAALHASVTAAAAEEPIRMVHLVRAVARELYKMGRQINRVHFGDYMELVQDLF